MPEGTVKIESEGDIVAVRKTVREISCECGFGITDVTRIVTAASELARNVYHYAGHGDMLWHILEISDSIGIELIFIDQGPGIEDIDQAMEMGYTTGKGMGLGLPGSKRLMGELEIQSQVGKGTTVTVRKWLKKQYEQSGAAGNNKHIA
ncbi:anti-sigma regulatory factor [bacterium]|nr:anti-sigma regulatory factor [bacterium]